MKTLYIVGGAMGVGKTAVCQKIKSLLHNSVFLDGDWCWDANPFVVTDETKRIVVDNICHTLNNFIGCSAYENIIFCWVMHEQSIIDDILGRLDLEQCAVKTITLTCDEQTLISRLQKDIDGGVREADVVERALYRLASCRKLQTIKIDTTAKSIEEVAEEILLI